MQEIPSENLENDSVHTIKTGCPERIYLELEDELKINRKRMQQEILL